MMTEQKEEQQEYVKIPFQYMVQSSIVPNDEREDDSLVVKNYYPVLVTDVSLSFWGGIDPTNGYIIDITHPLYNTCITDTIFVLPSGRGSCTASQVLLELLLNNIHPRYIVLRDNDPMVSIGAIIQQEIIIKSSSSQQQQQKQQQQQEQQQKKKQKPFDIVHIGRDGFESLLSLSTNTNTDENGIINTNVFVGRIDPILQSLVVKHRDSTVDEAFLSSKNVEQQQQQQQQHHSSQLQLQKPQLNYTEQELALLANSKSIAETMSLNVIFRYARLCTTSSTATNNINTTVPKYVPISCSHIDGCTYIGNGGIQFVQTLVNNNGSVKVPTTLNSISIDRYQWSLYGMNENYVKNSLTLANSYELLGCTPTYTCAPYMVIDNSYCSTNSNNNNNSSSTKNGSTSIYTNTDIAWGESNAVVYANSVLGARTEKYADYLDICCAITGIVPYVGVHIQQNRIPTIILDATILLQQIKETQARENDNINNNNKNSIGDVYTVDDNSIDLLFPTLGYVCGLLSDGHIPILIGFHSWTCTNGTTTTTAGSTNNRMTITNDHLKSFCAAYGTTGSTPLIHIASVTPEVYDPHTIATHVQRIINDNNSNNTLADVPSSITDHKYYLNIIKENQDNNKNVIVITEELLEQTYKTLNQSYTKSTTTTLNSTTNPLHDESGTTISTTTTDDSCNRKSINSSITNNTIDLVAIGNPHLSVSECTNIAKYIQQLNNTTKTVSTTSYTTNKTILIKNKTRIVACMSQTVYNQVPINTIQILKAFGIEFVFDTCWCMILHEPLIPPKVRVLTASSNSIFTTHISDNNNDIKSNSVIVDKHVSTMSSLSSTTSSTNTTPTSLIQSTTVDEPKTSIHLTTILTNSGKYAHYGPALTGRRYRLASMKDCITAAWTGYLNPITVVSPWKTTTTGSSSIINNKMNRQNFSTNSCTFQSFHEKQFIHQRSYCSDVTRMKKLSPTIAKRKSFTIVVRNVFRTFITKIG